MRGSRLLFALGLSFLFIQGCSRSPSGAPAQPLFSGTLSFVAFGSDGYTHVYLLSGSGAITQLTSGPANDYTPEWSFDGSRIVFQRADASGSAVYVMNADGTGITRLSPTPGRDGLPGFSPDGTRIVFSYVVSNNTCHGTQPTTHIMTMSSLDGSGRTTLLDGTIAATCFNGEPRYSPDGTKIAFMCSPYNSGGQVCTINPDGTGFAFLTSTSSTVAGDPHWSWDSKKLAISRRDTSGNVNAWTLNADGSNLTQVTTFTEPVEGGDVGWSLDNSTLAFEQDTGGSGQSLPNAPASISLIGAGGTSYRSLGVSCSDVGCSPRFRPQH